MGIFDLDGNPLTSASFSLISGQTTTMSILIDCETDYILKGYPLADVIVRAKHVGDTFVDIEVNPISLTPWNGTREQFDIEFQVGTITVYRRELVLFDVVYNV